MSRRLAFVSLVLSVFFSQSLVQLAVSQTAPATASTLPHLVRFSGTAKDVRGNVLSGIVGITFALYAEQTGGAALWLETQNVTADSGGRYSVLLGSTKPAGLPAEMFASEQARWIGVQVSGQGEQPRVLLVSAPYALKAGDAETLGGLPPSAFMLAAPPLGAASAPANVSIQGAALAPASSDVTTTGGTVNAIPLFSTTANIQDSAIVQTGTGATAKIGIGLAAPAAALDIKGGEYVRGAFTLPATATATATKGGNSQPDVMIASVFNGTTSTAVNQKFQLQAEPSGNDTATASGTLNLLYGSGTAAPVETGLKINALGQITFATGQAFPGAGTITGITTAAGSGLAGGGTSGTLSLNVRAEGITNVMLANPSLTVKPGTDLTGGGVVALGGSTTLSLDTTKVPVLGAANTFVGNQAVTGNLTATGEVQGANVNATTEFDLGGNTFAVGSVASENVFLGFAGNSTVSGVANTAAGYGSLSRDTTGGDNTAVGFRALVDTTTGTNNTGVGSAALFLNSAGTGNTAVGGASAPSTQGNNNTAAGYQSLVGNSSGNGNTAVGASSLGPNTSGSFNTAVGYEAETSTAAISNGTAVGAFANVNANNSLVLGQSNAGTEGSTWVNVGIGTTQPRSTLEASVAVMNGLGPTFTLTNPITKGSASAASVDFNTSLPSKVGTYNPSARIIAVDAGGFSDNFLFQSNIPGAANSGLQTNVVILAAGQVLMGSGPYADDQLGIYQTTVYSDANPTFPTDAVGAYGFNAPSGSGLLAGTGVQGYGGNGDPSSSTSSGSEGGVFYGGGGTEYGGDGIFAVAGEGAEEKGITGYAGYFEGDVWVSGELNAAAKDFKIDHPLDPANKYLFHASVESSEMMNIYTGNVTTDAQGEAVVALPDWFEAVNTDFRYQLTVIGQFAQAIVSSEVTKHQFSVRTDKPNVKVSWQITGVRHDAYAKAHPLIVEQQKNARERGRYIHPELYGAPEEQSVAWTRRPETIVKTRRVRAEQLAAASRKAETVHAQTLPLAIPPNPKDIHPALSPTAVRLGAQQKATPPATVPIHQR
jgi:hypothetical protein